MKLDGCHQCRALEPKEAMVVDVKADGICSDFHGNLDLVVHEKGADSSEKKAEINLKTQIFFTIESAEPLAAENRRNSSTFVDAEIKAKVRTNLKSIYIHLSDL